MPGIEYWSAHVNSESSVRGDVNTRGGSLRRSVETGDEGNEPRSDDGSDDDWILRENFDSDNNNESDSNMNDFFQTGLKKDNKVQKGTNRYNINSRRMPTKKRHRHHHRSSSTHSKTRPSINSSLSPHSSPLHPLVFVFDLLDAKPMKMKLKMPRPSPRRLLLTLRDRTSTRRDWSRECVVTTTTTTTIAITLITYQNQPTHFLSPQRLALSLCCCQSLRASISVSL